MVDVSKLKEEELVKLQEEDYNLEDLIILGEEKKIPILIEFPTPEGKKVKAKALIKQLTLKEVDNLKINKDNTSEVNSYLLSKSLFKTTGDNFSKEELASLPLGVVNAIASKIIELSGVDLNIKNDLLDF